MRRHPPMAAAAALALTTLTLAGCDGDDNGDSETTASAPPVAQGTADRRVVKRIPLDSTPEQVVAQIGRPARTDRQKSGRGALATCYIYGVAGGRPTDQIRMCFVKDELDSVLVLPGKR